MWIGSLLGISDQNQSFYILPEVHIEYESVRSVIETYEVVRINGQMKTMRWLKVYYDNPDIFVLWGVLECSNWVVP